MESTGAEGAADPSMPNSTHKLILGEFRRALDDRFRLSIPSELCTAWGEDRPECMLAKEQPGCLSLWPAEQWRDHLESGVRVVESKLQAGRLSQRVADVQLFGRLLSTRHRPIQLAGRGRLLIPEGFREFLGVEAGGEVLVVGAAVCIEIWRLEPWLAHLQAQIPRFGEILEDLSS